MAKLYFHYSAMNAGKSTALLQANRNYAERGMRTLLYTAKADERYGKGEIVSRIGIRAEADTFGEGDDLLATIRKAHASGPIDCILLDEAQFLSREQVLQLGRVADELGVPVLAYGLRTDFRGELFEGSKALLAWADDLKEIKTVCHCGKKATMVARVNESGKAVTSGEQVEIGGNERYVSLCRRHFRAGQTEPER